MCSSKQKSSLSPIASAGAPTRARLKDGQLWAVFGTPGADNQVQVNLQIMTAMADFGLDPQQAAELPRWTSHVSGQYANYPHTGPDELIIERRFSEEVRRDLARRGHSVDTV